MTDAGGAVFRRRIASGIVADGTPSIGSVRLDASVDALDPNFRVLVTHGLTDVQAPYFATALELARLPPFAMPDRLAFVVYPGGHMFYGGDDSRKAFREDAGKLIESR